MGDDIELIYSPLQQPALQLDSTIAIVGLLARRPKVMLFFPKPILESDMRDAGSLDSMSRLNQLNSISPVLNTQCVP